MMITIKDAIFADMDELSPAEKKVARSLLSGYPSAGLASAASLAQRAGTSTRRVLRPVNRLGLRNYRGASGIERMTRWKGTMQINRVFRARDDEPDTQESMADGAEARNEGKHRND